MMTTCEQARQTALQGEGSAINTAVLEHLRRCPECRALVEFSRESLALAPMVAETPELGQIFRRAAVRRKRQLVWRVAALAVIGMVAVTAWGITVRQRQTAERAALEMVLAWDGIEAKMVELEAAIDADVTAWKQQIAIN